ncbi:MBOAT, membrane-bound O-acyltransferase family-domain-containing protein [Aspergillus tetrazonus]
MNDQSHDELCTLCCNTALSNNPSSLAIADARLQHRMVFGFCFGVIFLIALHGVSAAKVFLISYTNFKIATRLPRNYLPDTKSVQDVGARIDNYSGLIPRWELLFKISILRQISLDMDYYWAQEEGSLDLIEKKHGAPSLLGERDRASYGANLRDFSLKTYLAYTLYSPLYLAGPILSFNKFVFQSHNRLPTTSIGRTFLYGLRFLIVLLYIELLLHYSYAVAIFKTSPSWTRYTHYQLAMLGYFNLHAVWLTLLFFWRFFHNYSTLASWRGWHRSMNRWIVRYIYVPLGGNGGGKVKSMVNILAVFSFIVLWRDINLRLLALGWLTTLFILPEDFCGIGAVVNILMMMVASLVSFVMSVHDVKEMVKASL